ncbi:glutamine-hydrolyzing carbamoyl-phosphate synthase small subunit [Candidatus Margulisiibacteriota bacterium]
MKAKLIFEKGRVFEGKLFAGAAERIGEVIFNTAMSGYQEVLTDPSYHGQMVLMTYPLIGSYGINEDDIESRKLFLKALLVKEYIDFPSNWRSIKSLKAYLEENNIIGAEGFDTRAITKYIRTAGAQKALLTSTDDPIAKQLEKIKAAPGLLGANLVKNVTIDKKYTWHAESKAKYKVAVIDCGVKYNILRMLSKHNCECTVYPAGVSAEEILGKGYDGIFLSNGPGDPEPVKNVVKTVRECLGKLPIFGICLGHQILGLALGGKTYKLKFGHHGVNHPVKNLQTGHVEITSQNHGFCVDIDSLNKNEIEVTHINLNDQTVEGIRHKKYPAFSVQYHPEAAPGPHDSAYLFQDFIKMMKGFKT